MTVAFAGLLIFTSCNKEGSVAPDESETFSEASTIAVPATAAGAIAGATTDSVYMVGACNHNENRYSI